MENVDGILALHVDPNRANRQSWDYTRASKPLSVRDFAIEVHGRGGHAARPYATYRSDLQPQRHLVTLIYQHLPRSADARDPLVVTIGMIQARLH